MNLRSGFLLFATVLVCAGPLSSFWVMAETVKPPPRPGEAPPRVPFSAFRIKPILSPQLDQSLVTPEETAPVPAIRSEKKTKTPAKRVQIRPAPSAAVPDTAGMPASDARPLIATPIVKPEPKPFITPLESASPRETSVGSVTDEPEADIPTLLIMNGRPVPARKPGSRSEPLIARPIPADSDAPFNPAQVSVQRTQTQREKMEPGNQRLQPRAPDITNVPGMAAPSQGNAELPPLDAGTAAAVANPAYTKPVEILGSDRTERIRDRSRFGEKQRMAGSGGASRITSVFGFNRSTDMKNIPVGPLNEGEGVSPVLLPGHTMTVAAPDKQGVDQRGLPSEVIVFFVENSAEMEVGQMDILNTDVLEMMRQRDDLRLDISGYSEPMADGSTDKMAMARALMVRDYLRRQRIDTRRLTVQGKGDDTKVEPRDRVEMFFTR